MIWILSFILCALLALGTLMIMFPELMLPFVDKRWRSHSHYYRNY